MSAASRLALAAVLAVLPAAPVPAEKTLADLTYLTSHNAHVSTGDAKWFPPNQGQSLRKQLTDGVRGLMLDLHMYGNEVHLCHNDGRECGPVPGLHHGIPRQSFAGALRTIVDFLNENRGEVVTLLLEDYADASALSGTLAGVSGLNDLVFRPDEWKVREQGWPKLSEMVARNKRLLMLSSAPGRESMGVFYGKDYTVENYWSIGPLGDKLECVSRWSDVPLNKTEPNFTRLFVMNHFRDVPVDLAVRSDNGDKLAKRVRETCTPAAGRKPNFVAVDFYEQPASGTRPASVVADLNR
ncbi:PI-PLC domain-containing protein [Allokutzneria oryzae]|uniref:PI-PLC domain-containing protein n=1 Tax=Allokutzneria oryzae TaxID=1378989 RepID=A0ABV5ZNN1_9PSEU